MQTKESSVIYNQSPEEILDRTIRLDVNSLASFRATLTVILYMQIFRELSTRFINTQNQSLKFWSASNTVVKNISFVLLDMDDITDFNRILLLLKLEVTFSGYKHSGGAVVEKGKKKQLCLIALRIPLAKGDHYCFLILKTNKPPPKPGRCCRWWEICWLYIAVFQIQELHWIPSLKSIFCFLTAVFAIYFKSRWGKCKEELSVLLPCIISICAIHQTHCTAYTYFVVKILLEFHYKLLAGFLYMNRCWNWKYRLINC